MEDYQAIEAQQLIDQVNAFIAEKHLCIATIRRFAGSPGESAVASRLEWLNRAIDNIFSQLDDLIGDYATEEENAIPAQ